MIEITIFYHDIFPCSWMMFCLCRGPGIANLMPEEYELCEADLVFVCDSDEWLDFEFVPNLHFSKTKFAKFLSAAKQGTP